MNIMIGLPYTTTFTALGGAATLHTNPRQKLRSGPRAQNHFVTGRYAFTNAASIRQAHRHLVAIMRTSYAAPFGFSNKVPNTRYPLAKLSSSHRRRGVTNSCRSAAGLELAIF